MLREDLKKNSTEITEDRTETAAGSGDSGQGSLSEKEVYDVLSENSRKVINVSASYAFLSSLTKDYPQNLLHLRKAFSVMLPLWLQILFRLLLPRRERMILPILP